MTVLATGLAVRAPALVFTRPAVKAACTAVWKSSSPYTMLVTSGASRLM